MGTGCGMSGSSSMAILMVRFRLSARLRRRRPRNCSKSGPAGRGSSGKLANWAKPRTSCNSFNIFIRVAICSLNPVLQVTCHSKDAKTEVDADPDRVRAENQIDPVAPVSLPAWY